MLEVARLTVDSGWVPPRPVVFLFNGAEELFMLVRHDDIPLYGSNSIPTQQSFFLCLIFPVFENFLISLSIACCSVVYLSFASSYQQQG